MLSWGSSPAITVTSPAGSAGGYPATQPVGGSAPVSPTGEVTADGSICREQSYVSRASGLSRGQSVRGSCASTSPPPSSGHGTSTRQRRFVSRHVPEGAEELVHSQVLTPEMVSRFNGLMRHLKHNSDWEEQQKQVMVSNVEALVPEEYEDMLQGEFERRCAFGNRTNTELMSSHKYVKLLRECGVVRSFDADKRKGSGASSPLASVSEGESISLASADVIYLKVLHDCSYGSKRLTYDLFCKALYLVSCAARPDLGGEAAFSELLARIAAVSPEDPSLMEPKPDLMLDPNVLLVLDHFKPALYDVFHTFCNRQLGCPSAANVGMGSVRLAEKTFWKHTQDTNLSGCSFGGTLGRSTMYGNTMTDRSMNGGLDSQSPRSTSPKGTKAGQVRLSDEDPTDDGDGVAQAAAGEVATSPRTAAAAVAGAGGPGEAVENDRDASCKEAESASATRLSFGHSAVFNRRGEPAQNAEADAGGGYAEISRRPASPSSLLQGDVGEPIFEDRLTPSMGGGSLRPGRERATTGADYYNTMYSGITGVSQDPYQYMNGQPVIRNRRQHMAVSQLLHFCKQLQIMPELVSRLEVIRIFKRAQCAGSQFSHGSSLYGYLNVEAFMDAAGQLALCAYDKSPFHEEYPEPQEKIHAFFMSVLPSSSREVHERFLYGCSGRGR